MGYYYNHGAPRTRSASLFALLLAGFTLIASTAGQVRVLHVVCTDVASDDSPPSVISSLDMLCAFVAFMSIVGGSWLLAVVKHRQGMLSDVEMEPLLYTLLKETTTEVDISERVGFSRGFELTYLPYFIAGNTCLGIWSLLWLSEWYITSQIALLANLIIQNYAIFIALHSWTRPDLHMSKKTWPTHLLVKGQAALAILLLWNNSGILERSMPPSFLEMLNNGTIFVLMAVGGGPDPTLSLFLLYDLCALAYGTGANADWQIAFHYTGFLVFLVLIWDLYELSRRPSFEGVMDDIVDDIMEGEIRLQSEVNENDYRRL